jgi:plasmid stability protein
VLDAMLGPGVRIAQRVGASLERELREILVAVETGAQTPDAVASRLDLTGAEAAAALATLEALGYLSCSLVGVYSRTLLSPPGN